MTEYKMIKDEAQKRLRMRVDALINIPTIDDVGLTEWVYMATADLRDVYKRELQEEIWQQGYKSGYNDAAQDIGIQQNEGK